MLIPFLLGDVVEEPTWTGEVKAFAYYLTPELLPREHIATVFVGRKRYGDGSTVSAVRVVPLDNMPTARAARVGEGWIERDRNGGTVRVETKVISRFDGKPIAEAAFKFDPKKNVLIGSGSHLRGSEPKVALADRNLFLCPLEAVAFGPPTSLATGWSFAGGPYGYVDAKASAVGMRYLFGMPHTFAFELNGNREAFRRIDLIRQYLGAAYEEPQKLAGALLFHTDGRLAALVPSLGQNFFDYDQLPGMPGWFGSWTKSGARPIAPPPFELKGKLAEMWKRGLRENGSDGLGASFARSLYIPISVSAQDRVIVLASIQKPEPVGEAPEMDDVSPTDG